MTQLRQQQAAAQHRLQIPHSKSSPLMFRYRQGWNFQEIWREIGKTGCKRGKRTRQ